MFDLETADLLAALRWVRHRRRRRGRPGARPLLPSGHAVAHHLSNVHEVVAAYGDHQSERIRSEAPLQLDQVLFQMVAASECARWADPCNDEVDARSLHSLEF